jgi:hypothetical protein
MSTIASQLVTRVRQAASKKRAPFPDGECRTCPELRSPSSLLVWFSQPVCVCVRERSLVRRTQSLGWATTPNNISRPSPGGGGMSCVAGDLILLVPFVWQVVTLLLSAARATWHGHLVTPNSVGGPPLGWWYIWFSHIPCQKGLIGSQSECLVEEWWRG